MSSESWTNRQIQRKREKARKMALRRWELDRQRRDEWARMEAADPLRCPGKIIRRIVVVENESVAREVIIREFDSAREILRKLRSVGLCPARKVVR